MKCKFVCKLNFGVDVKFFGSRQPLGYNRVSQRNPTSGFPQNRA
jgi:hypothetical protein